MSSGELRAPCQLSEFAPRPGDGIAIIGCGTPDRIVAYVRSADAGQSVRIGCIITEALLRNDRTKRPGRVIVGLDAYDIANIIVPVNKGFVKRMCLT